MKDNIASIVSKALSQKIADMGYELYEVDYSKKQNGMNLTLFITKGSESVTIDDCEKVHRMADVELDAINPTADAPYYLNVSSVGLDKPLKTSKDYARGLSKELEIKLFTPHLGKKEYVGTLSSFDEENITLSNDGSTLVLPRKNVALCKFHIDF